MSESWLEFLLFNAFVLVLLFLDLGVFQKKSHAIKVKEALIMSGTWISIALLFNVYVYCAHGPQKALEFFTGFIIEKSLSVDNLFVFLTIFSFFAVPAAFQQKVLFWGILMAMVLRGFFIFAGIGLIEKFSWLIYVFGVFLVYTGIKIYMQKDREKVPGEGMLINFIQKTLPFSKNYDADRFITKENGKKLFTKLFLVFLVINFVDVIFAFDSIPAIFSITLDPFIVYSSNIFAILGLRALYFVLSGAAAAFYYVNHALAAILVFVGGKMLVSKMLVISPGISLAVIAVVLTAAIIASVARNKRHGRS
jgi:tellurite resistance protein TerC